MLLSVLCDSIMISLSSYDQNEVGFNELLDISCEMTVDSQDSKQFTCDVCHYASKFKAKLHTTYENPL